MLEKDPLSQAIHDNANTIWNDPKRVEAELSGRLLLPKGQKARATVSGDRVLNIA